MIFIWAFLPIVFILDKVTGKSRRLQNVLLLAASLLFYAWGQPSLVWLLLVSILINYVLGLLLGSQSGAFAKKEVRILVLTAGILANLGILGYYKYFNFFVNTINKLFGRQLF